MSESYMANLIYGIHAVQAILTRSPGSIQRIYVLAGKQNPRLEALVDEAVGHRLLVTELSRDELDKMAKGGVHQGIVATVSVESAPMVTLDTLFERTEKLFLLVLDGIQDPHNLGACLRVADAAGVDAIIAPKDHAVSLTPTVRKVACGAAETVPYIQVTNLARTLKEIQERGIWVYGAAGEAEETLYEKALERPLAIVMGAEGKGLRRLTREHCDFLVKIPMRGSVDSLNVSVAAGICCFEVVRQSLLL
jgi:23S rRNA (guanosine2251-2'-O)-methyltransferase